VHKRRLGTLCADCHNARDWRIWDFDHDQRTRFRLTGAHRRLECLSCHRAPATGKVVVRDSTCRSCHERDDIHHGQFGAQCDRCHVDTNWRSLKQRLSSKEGGPS
jgi:hypothetical protein